MKDNFGTHLVREIETWVREGLVTAEQGERLAARYRMGGTPSRLIGVITLIGGGLIASGLALVIANNWERLSDWTKIVGLLLLMIGFYAGGFEARGRGFARSGDALLMIGAALFLCGIALVAQIFHLNSRPPNGVLLWLVAIVPIAYMLRSGPILFLAILGTLAWITLEAGTPDSLLYLGGSRNAPGLWFIFDVLFGNWTGLMGLQVATGVALIAGGALHRGAFKKFQRVFDMPGLLLFGAGLYWLTFLRHQHDFYGASLVRPVQPVLLFAILGTVLAGLAWRNYPALPPRTRDVQVGTLIVGIAFVLPPVLMDILGARDLLFGETYSLLLAIYLLGASIAFISAGVRWERPGWVNLGLCFVGLNIITRYFDLLGSRLEGGLLFISGGVLMLFIGVVLEKQRRRLMRRITLGASPS
ncbi:MAG TPA: DUF2157 domain-containing protein [Candidatus Polarisedimenticolia bacterium]|nr:DUF2157 domain-containing protein [Candidatus Polarisedimenticolia bacterium]